MDAQATTNTELVPINSGRTSVGANHGYIPHLSETASRGTMSCRLGEFRTTLSHMGGGGRRAGKASSRYCCAGRNNPEASTAPIIHTAA